MPQHSELGLQSSPILSTSIPLRACRNAQSPQNIPLRVRPSSESQRQRPGDLLTSDTHITLDLSEHEPSFPPQTAPLQPPPAPRILNSDTLLPQAKATDPGCPDFLFNHLLRPTHHEMSFALSSISDAPSPLLLTPGAEAPGSAGSGDSPWTGLRGPTSPQRSRWTSKRGLPHHPLGEQR